MHHYIAAITLLATDLAQTSYAESAARLVRSLPDSLEELKRIHSALLRLAAVAGFGRQETQSDDD